MSATIFDTWSDDRWASEVEQWSRELPQHTQDALTLIYREGRSYEDAAEVTSRRPVELLVQTLVGVRLIQEHMQRAHATIEPPWPRRGTGVPGAPIPKYQAVIRALKSLGPVEDASS